MILDDGGDSEPSTKSAKLTFRSYEPQSDLGEKRDGVDLFAVEKVIADQLADTQDTGVVEQIDIATLAPRKVACMISVLFVLVVFSYRIGHVSCFKNNINN